MKKYIFVAITLFVMMLFVFSLSACDSYAENINCYLCDTHGCVCGSDDEPPILCIKCELEYCICQHQNNHPGCSLDCDCGENTYCENCCEYECDYKEVLSPNICPDCDYDNCKCGDYCDCSECDYCPIPFCPNCGNNKDVCYCEYECEDKPSIEYCCECDKGVCDCEGELCVECCEDCNYLCDMKEKPIEDCEDCGDCLYECEEDENCGEGDKCTCEDEKYKQAEYCETCDEYPCICKQSPIDDYCEYCDNNRPCECTPIVNVFMVNFNSNGGARVESQEVQKGSTISFFLTPYRHGFYFSHWELNGQAFDLLTPIYFDITLSAIWTTEIIVAPPICDLCQNDDCICCCECNSYACVCIKNCSDCDNCACGCCAELSNYLTVIWQICEFFRILGIELNGSLLYEFDGKIQNGAKVTLEITVLTDWVFDQALQQIVPPLIIINGQKAGINLTEDIMHMHRFTIIFYANALDEYLTIKII